MTFNFSIFHSVPLALRLLLRDWTRLIVTVTGVGFAIILMFFLTSVYEGVRIECNGYVAGRKVDVWIAQKNTTNLIRSSSFLRESHAVSLGSTPGVASIVPLLRLITTLSTPKMSVTAFVCGIWPSAPETIPNVIDGSGTLRKGEIILDYALARKMDLAVGDSLQVQGKPYRVTGISNGTNVIISQFTFINLMDAQEILGFPGIVSFFLIRAKGSVSTTELAARLRARASGLNVFTADKFSANNLEEMRTGLLPILATVGIFGGIIGSAILTLLLYSMILERREDYALLKAIGAGHKKLQFLVWRQALVSVCLGFIFGLVGYELTYPIVLHFVPVLAVALLPGSVILIGGLAFIMGGIGALLPLSKLKQIYPAEVFRA